MHPKMQRKRKRHVDDVFEWGSPAGKELSGGFKRWIY
jgi:hypothetical protein